jgi:hypothetical protein
MTVTLTAVPLIPIVSTDDGNECIIESIYRVFHLEQLSQNMPETTSKVKQSLCITN